MQDALINAQRGRWAVAALFFANGFMLGSWAPHIPLLKDRLAISEATLGLLILCFGLGAVAAMVNAGRLIAGNGSRKTLHLFSLTTIIPLLLVVLAPNVWLAALALVYFGATIGAMDVSMNSNAVAVERRLGRAIMSSSHGFWSLGGFAGGGLGGILIQTYGFIAHAVFATVVVGILVAAAWRSVVADVHAHAESGAGKFRWPREWSIYLLGAVALLCMNAEGAVLDWAALYLRQEQSASIATAGFAFAAFSGAMAIMRFAGDGVRNRFGAVTTFRASLLIAAAGMLVAGLSPWAWLSIAAFALCGLGIANAVPILFSAAGNRTDLSHGAGMSVVTTMGYSGILVAPSIIGFVGGHVGFRPVYIVVAILLALMIPLAGMAANADMDKGN